MKTLGLLKKDETMWIFHQTPRGKRAWEHPDNIDAKRKCEVCKKKGK